MVINGTLFRDAVISGANHLAANRRAVDELNVFPVPDGDTGTNMTLTLKSAVREISELRDRTVSEIADIAASALLRGARGNSGVILSLLFRGVAQGLKGFAEADGPALAGAFKAGVEEAYKAVMKPTEGTILTVARLSAEKAAGLAAQNSDALAVFETMYTAALAALAETPELLPVLKKAGVVDAGGKGLALIFEGMLSVFKSGVILTGDGGDTAALPQTGIAAQFDGEITFTYCTEFIIEQGGEPGLEPLALRAYLETIGDSVVTVDDGQIIKVHLHTDHPGDAIERALAYGSLVNIKIDNMRDQHERARHDVRTGEDEPAEQDGSAPQTELYGFVAVAAGEGLGMLFKDLGADTIVNGGQTMNPSTEAILRAVENTPAQTVFVLPNNKNIIMAAEQAVPLASRRVIVLHSRSIPMGISAMLAFDPAAPADDNAVHMDTAMQAVSTGLITYAARNSEYEGMAINEGELLALENGRLAFTEQDMNKAVIRLLGKMCSKKRGAAFITIIYGETVSEEDAQAVKTAAEAKYPGAEITLVDGGQPVYFYILSVE